MKRFIFFLPVLLLLFFSAGFIRKKKIKIDGVWKVIEVQTIKKDKAKTSIFPTESQVIFADNNYSFCWTSHSTSLRNWVLPDSVKLSRFNQSLINTGTFELKDSILITKAVFAMQPMFVGGEARFACSFAGDTLILTGISVFSSENIPNPAYANGAYFITKLVRNKRQAVNGNNK